MDDERKPKNRGKEERKVRKLSRWGEGKGRKDVGGGGNWKEDYCSKK